MRIVCQKCAAAYAIDDRLISPKGVRAQCPRCRHLQLVKRDATSEASSPAAPAQQLAQPAPPSPRPSGTPAAGNSAVAVDLFNEFGTAADPDALPPDPLFDGLVPPASAPARPAASAPARPAAPAQGGSSGDPLLDFLGPPPAAPPPPVVTVPRRAPGPSFASPGGAPPAQGARPQDPLAGSGAQAQATPGCRECGKPLADPFDQAIGTCDDCRGGQDRSAQVSPATPPPNHGSSASSPPIELPPLESIDMSEVAVQAPALAPEPRSGIRSSPPRPYVSNPSQPPMTAVRTSGGGAGGVLKGLLIALVLLGVGVGGAYWYLVLHSQGEEIVQPIELTGPAPIPEAIQAALSRWELRYLDLEGTSIDQLEVGVKHLAKDQRSAYAEAEEAFQQALLLNKSSDAAIAGYVQALALGRGTSLDKNTYEEALALIQAAEERAGRTALMLLSHANLLLARPNQPQAVEQARQLAEEALTKGTDLEKAEAHLVLGRAYLKTSMGLANQHFDAALTLSPKLQRVHYHRALAHESAGAYSLAIEALKGRLEKDPEHWDSLATMARIYLEVGEVEQARKLYESRTKGPASDMRASLMLAVLRYQVDGNAAAAARELRALLKNRQKYLERDVAEALVHLAAAERMAGSVDAGVKAAEEALALVKELPAAHLQLFLAALGRGDAAKAATYLAGFQGKTEDVALEKVLEGRLRLAERKFPEALELFQEAARLDSRRQDALLLSGISAAGAGRRDEAFKLFFQVLQADPLWPSPRPVMTLYFLRPGETLLGMQGSIQALSSSEADVSAPLYEGLLLYHLGDRSGAERRFRNVLELDPNNAGAAAYLSLIALQRGEGSKARTFGSRALAVGRQMPIAHLANGLALAEGKQLEPAKRSLRDALTLAPGLLAAEVKLAELEKSSSKDSARARLLKVTGLDPTYVAAKRLLFIMDRGG
jgi:cellulose synthase operon protein C